MSYCIANSNECLFRLQPNLFIKLYAGIFVVGQEFIFFKAFDIFSDFVEQKIASINNVHL